MSGKIRRFTTRTLPKPLELTFENERGERTTEEFTLVYASYSQRALDEIEAGESNTIDGGTLPYSTLVAYMVRSITDKGDPPSLLTGDDGEPVRFYDGTTAGYLQSARDFFETADIKETTQAIWEAIQADINPQKATSESGPSGSKTEASEASLCPTPA